jgi:hypothetical protein
MVYAALTGSASTDLAVAAGSISRSKISDAGTLPNPFLGRAVGLPIGASVVRTSLHFDQPGMPGMSVGLFVNVVSAAEFTAAQLFTATGTVRVYSVAAGKATLLKEAVMFEGALNGTLEVERKQKRLMVTVAGEMLVSLSGLGAPSAGGVYIYDANTSASGGTRTYDDFKVSTPAAYAATATLRWSPAYY